MVKALRIAAVVGIALVTLVTLVGCGVGRHVQTGMNHYHAGDYNAAMAQWDDLETQESDMNPKGRVRYLVYRGLTLKRLGKNDEALQYLLRGREAYDRGDPGWLHAHAIRDMQLAISELSPKDARPVSAEAPPASSATPH